MACPSEFELPRRPRRLGPPQPRPTTLTLSPVFPRVVYSIVAFFLHLLGISLVSKNRKLRGEAWRARAPKPKGTVHAQALGITAALGADRLAADKAQTHCPRLEGLVPGF